MTPSELLNNHTCTHVCSLSLRQLSLIFVYVTNVHGTLCDVLGTGDRTVNMGDSALLFSLKLMYSISTEKLR